MLQEKTNELRIIGGTHRGRRLHFPDAPGLRPTSDRIRETLFNWLTPVIQGARCLDLFAGSGALSFEALSRGAAEVIMIEPSPVVVNQLRSNLSLLMIECSQVIQTEALSYLDTASDAFDIIFLDPPFDMTILPDCIEKIHSHQLCAPKAHIYIEAPKSMALPQIPDDWQWYRNKSAGQVGYHLIHCF